MEKTYYAYIYKKTGPVRYLFTPSIRATFEGFRTKAQVRRLLKANSYAIEGGKIFDSVDALEAVPPLAETINRTFTYTRGGARKSWTDPETGKDYSLFYSAGDPLF